MASQYDPYWKENIDQIVSIMKEVLISRVPQKIDVSGIKSYGDRNKWYGTTIVYQGEIVGGGSY